VTVISGDKRRSFSLESGGAKVIQSFAARLACALFLSAMKGTPMKMVMLDEIAQMLDESNRRRVMDLIVGGLSSEFGLEQILVVSHHQDVVGAIDNLLHVRRERGTSVAEWE
jgi:exonuclease SbcC